MLQKRKNKCWTNDCSIAKKGQDQHSFSLRQTDQCYYDIPSTRTLVYLQQCNRWYIRSYFITRKSIFNTPSNIPKYLKYSLAKSISTHFDFQLLHERRDRMSLISGERDNEWKSQLSVPIGIFDWWFKRENDIPWTLLQHQALLMKSNELFGRDS